MMSDLTVIIPTLSNAKGVDYLKKYFKNKNYQLKIIDNSKKNLGFAGAINSVISDQRLAASKWLLILNDDVEFLEEITNNKSQITNKYQISNNKYSKDTIQGLIKFAEERKLEAVAPVLVNPQGKIENLGYRVLPYGKIELITTSHQSPTTSHQPDGLTAACLLIRSNVFKKLGGFDEKFFAYLEDVDFFLRFKKAGYSFGVCQNVKVVHHHQTTSGKMGAFKQRQDFINWWRLYFKHPDRFNFNLAFVIERLRNISGLVKAVFKSS